MGLYASLVNINAYHQPGVEAGKKAAAEVLELQHKIIQVLQDAGKALSLETLAEKAGVPDQIEAIYKILRHLATNQRGVLLVGNPGKPASLMASIHW